MLPTGSIPRLLQVHPEIDQISKDLYMPHRLHGSAHYPKRQPRFTTFHDEPRNNSVKRAFARRIDVRVRWLHGKQFSSVLEPEAQPGNYHSGSHSPKVTLNKRDHVSFFVRHAKIGSIALSQLSVASIVMESRFFHVDQLAACRCIVFG